MRSNKRIFGGILVVVVMLFGLSFLVNQKVIFAEDSKVFYFDDLSVGDYIPNGSTIIVGQDYSDYSGFDVRKVTFGYYAADGHRPSYLSDELGINSSYAVKSYDALFGETNQNYSGWVVKYLGNYSVSLEPSIGGVVEVAKPSENNDYTLELDGEVDEIKWYKYEDLENFSTDSDNSLWTKDGDTWIFRNFDVSSGTLKTSTGYKEKVTFDIPASEKLYMGTKYSLCDYYMCDTFNGMIDDNTFVTNTSDACGSSPYRVQLFDFDDAENHILTFEYEQQQSIYTYFHLDAMTLTDLNQSEATLDTTDLQDGDKIFYMAKSGTQTFKGKFVVKKESEPIPDTADSILNYVILGIISISAIGLCIVYSKRVNV